MCGNGLSGTTSIGAGVIAAVVALCFAAVNEAEGRSFTRGALMDIEPTISRLRQEDAITEEERTIFYTLSLGKIYDVEYRSTEHGRRPDVETEPLEQEQAIELCDELLAREDLHPDLREWAEAKRLFLVRRTPLYFQKAMEWLDEFPEHPLNLNVRYDIANRFGASPRCPACYTSSGPRGPDHPRQWSPHALTCAEKLELLHNIYFPVYADRSVYDRDVLNLAYRYCRALGALAPRVAQAHYNDLRALYPDDEEARHAQAPIGSEKQIAVLRLMRTEAESIRAEIEAFLADPALQEAHQDTLRPEVATDALRMFNSLVNDAEEALARARRVRDNQIERAAGERSGEQIVGDEAGRTGIWMGRPPED